MTTAVPWLVTGAGGQVGRRVVECLGHAARGFGRGDLDITDDDAVRRAFAQVRPALVVNCAAYTNVDGAEAQPDVAYAVNGEGPAVLARSCRQAGIPLIHLSTDYVFDGTACRPYLEDDDVAPLGVYAASKVAGEQAVLTSGAMAVVLRLAWAFDHAEDGFIGAVLRRGRQQPRLPMVADQFGCPTPATAIAQAIVQVGQALLAGRGQGGIYHYCGAPGVCRLDWAREILDAGGWSHVELEPVGSDHFPNAARRPSYSALDCRRIAAVFGLEQPDWRAALRRAVGEATRGENP